MGTEAQLRFLLNEAPMMDMPRGLDRLAHSVTRYAYVNPKTFADATSGVYAAAVARPYIFIRPSPTKWVMTTLMPEGRVIFSQSPLPGIENILRG